MKKFIILSLLLFSIFISTVSADEIVDVSLTEYYSFYNQFINDYENNQSNYHLLIDEYLNNYSSTYPYYYISINIFTEVQYVLYAFDNDFPFNLDYHKTTYQNISNDILNIKPLSDLNSLTLSIDSTNNTITSNISMTTSDSSLNLYAGPNIRISRYPIISSNMSLLLNSVIDSYNNPPSNSLQFSFPTVSDTNYHFDSFTVSVGNYWPTYEELYDGSYIPSVDYAEINLNNYSYVALSLKNYNTDPFITNFLVKGQLCLTPVYDYGMKDKSDYYPGYQVQGCSPVYNNFTLTKVWILKQDIDNNAIYYLKAYDTSFDNIIKIDASKFNITYITSENADNPYVNINGTYYPTIPYSSLSSSSTVSESEGYISGQVCGVGDINCQAENSGFDISNLFTHPLELLKDMWTAITSVFTVITAFIILLPVPLQTFMYTAFMFAVILGILKILL